MGGFELPGHVTLSTSAWLKCEIFNTRLKFVYALSSYYIHSLESHYTVTPVPCERRL